MTVTRGDLTWSLNPSDFVHQDVFWHGTKDTWDVWHLRRILPADALIIDIGSNFGYYAIYLTNALGPKARAIAFEPLPDNFARLSRNIELNGLSARVTAVRMGLSNRPGTACMKMRSGNSGSAQIRTDGSGDVTIELATLDMLWDDLVGHDATADFVKIDVEGFEVATLTGARAILEKSHPIVLLEVDPPRLAEAGSSAGELQRFFDSLGYRYFIAQRQILKETTPEQAPELVNIHCLHKQRHADEIARWVGA